MAIYFKSTTPKKLLSTFRKAIDDGHVATWSYDRDGDFTHTAKQWNRLAWLRPIVEEGATLKMVIIKPKDQSISSEVYGIYHGRFIEAMLVHCDSLFASARATALPDDGDKVG